MPTYVFDFNLSAWIQNVEIEADSYEDAVEKLNRMSAADLIDEGYIKNTDITDIDCEEVEHDDEDDDYGDGSEYRDEKVY